jgi:hypothetical protein
MTQTTPAQDDVTPLSADPGLFWSDEEVSTITAVSLAEVKTEEGGKPHSWHPLVPVGKYHHPQFGQLEFTAGDVQEFADHFTAGVRGSDIPVDEIGAHEATPGGAAYGWLEQVQVRPDGLYGKIGWNKMGQSALEDDEYRYISPTLHTKTLPFTAQDGRKVGNVVKSICLTNRPVFKGQPSLQVTMSEYARVTDPPPDAQEDNPVEGSPAEQGETNMSDDAVLLAEERDTALKAAEDAAAALKAAQDQIAEMEQAVKLAEEQGESAVKLAEERDAAVAKLAEIEREQAVKFAEDTYRNMEFAENKRLAPAAVESLGKLHLALPEDLRDEFAEMVKSGGPLQVQFGELSSTEPPADEHAPKPAAELYAKHVKDGGEEFTERTVEAVSEWAEAQGDGVKFAEFDGLYEAFVKVGKPGVK